MSQQNYDGAHEVTEGIAEALENDSTEASDAESAIVRIALHMLIDIAENVGRIADALNKEVRGPAVFEPAAFSEEGKFDEEGEHQV